mmetsp:Transcript_43158/g.113360  ORF Transcript_43158/g.113360 Transcript_43158/m.113360 type:complete len:236 (-) Transcript_43158:461-1168(-)
MLAVFSAPAAFVPAVQLSATRAAQAGAAVQMRVDDTFAPAGMGKEYLQQPRKPLSEYVGASHELAAFPGGVMKPWDPMDFCELYKVSGNNPDVAWLREAELKHGRMSMLAVTGIIVQSSGLHLPGNAEVDFSGAADWANAPTTLPLVAWSQVILFIGLIEGTTSKGLFDLYTGVGDREPGNLGPLFGSGMLSKDPVAADKMRLKELKNARLAMIAWAGIMANHFIPGALPGCMYN